MATETKTDKAGADEKAKAQEAAQRQEAALKPEKGLLAKLGSIAVHAYEMMSPGGQSLDQHELVVRLNDPEVRKWLKDMGEMVPLPRTPWPSGEGK